MSSLVTVGSLGIRLAKTAEAPFYLVVEGISIFGVMERFEALISAALISSYFALICLLAWRALKTSKAYSISEGATCSHGESARRHSSALACRSYRTGSAWSRHPAN